MYPFNLLFRSANDNAAFVPGKPLSRQQKWVRGVIVVFGTFVFLCFLAADPLLRHFRKSNFRDALPQTGVATVAMVVAPQANFEGALKHEGDGFVNVRFQGRLYKVNTVRQIAQMREGQQVKIEYLTGRRGDVTVQAAEPLPNAPAEDVKP